MTKDDADKILTLLRIKYPDAKCELNFKTPFELLVAVILSAQCTDKRVNKITPALFLRASTPEQFAVIDASELERLIYSCGFYHNKAKNIILASRTICEKFGGKVPEDIDGLLTLPGVGRKTANVVYAVGFGGQAIAVDTHVLRTSNRIGLADAKTPEETEKQLREIINPSNYTEFHHLLIFHGRYCCKARQPDCADCPISVYCKYYSLGK